MVSPAEVVISFQKWDFVLPQYTETFCRIIRGKLWLSVDYPAERHAFPQSWLSVNYPVERHAFPQDSVQKLKSKNFPLILSRKSLPLRRIFCDYMPFRGLYCGKACLSAVESAENFDFQSIIPRKGMPFRGIICGKFWLSKNYTPERYDSAV